MQSIEQSMHMYIVNIVHRAQAKNWEEKHRISVIQMSILKVLRQDHPWLTMQSIWQIIDFIMPPKVRIVWMENQMKSGWHFLLAITLASERSVAMMIWNTFRHLRISNIETGFGYRNGYRMVGFEHKKNKSTRLKVFLIENSNIFYNLLFIVENTCICKDLVNKNGVGNCKGVKPSQFNGDHFACYVIQPSNCTDLKTSGTNPGEKLSAEACLSLGIRSFLAKSHCLKYKCKPTWNHVFPEIRSIIKKISGAGNDYNVDNNLRAWIFYLENIDNISMDETTATKLEVEIKIYIHLIILNQKIIQR